MPACALLPGHWCDGNLREAQYTMTDRVDIRLGKPNSTAQFVHTCYEVIGGAIAILLFTASCIHWVCIAGPGAHAFVALMLMHCMCCFACGTGIYLGFFGI